MTNKKPLGHPQWISSTTTCSQELLQKGHPEKIFITQVCTAAAQIQRAILKGLAGIHNMKMALL